MSKAIWQYAIFIFLFPVWWVLFFLMTILVSVLKFIINFEWSFMSFAKEFGLMLNPVKMFIKLECDLREEIKRQWKK